MGKVTSFNLEGIECWFHSQEHRPPHFHAKKRGHWHIRIYFMEAKSNMAERARGPRGRISSADRNTICDIAEWYRGELLLEWEKKVNCDG